MCVRAYVCMDCCNINESIEIDTIEGRSGLKIMALKIVWFEPHHAKTYKVAVRPAKTQISLGM